MEKLQSLADGDGELMEPPGGRPGPPAREDAQALSV